MTRQIARPRLKMTLIAAVTVGLLNGCGNDKSDLREWVNDVKARPGGRIEPIPEMRPMKAYRYSAFDLRSPFEPPVDPTRQRVDNGIRPDLDRQREELEQYPLDALAMRGILERQDQRYALVRDGDGIIHEVQVGNYMGQNFGQIVAISETEIILTEIVPDGQGGWREQPASLKLRADR